MRRGARLFLVAVTVPLLLLTFQGVANSEIRLTLWSTFTQEARVNVWKELINRFEAKKPGVRVELVTMPWGGALDKIVSSIIAGNPPDISVVGQGWPQTLAGTGGILELSDVIDRIGGAEQFVGTSLKISSLDSKVWAVPLYVTPQIIFYRASWLKSAGVDVPQDWEEFRKVAIAVTDISKQRYGYSVPFDIYGGNIVAGWLLTNSAKIFAKSSDGRWKADLGKNAVETFEFLADIIKNSAPSGAASYAYKDLRSLFITGKLAMITDTPNTLAEVAEQNPEILDDIEFMRVPQNKQCGSGMGYVGMVVCDTPNREYAKSFVEFLFEEDNFLHFTLAFPYIHFPPYKPVLDSPKYVDSLPSKLKSIAEEADVILECAAPIGQWDGPNPWGGEVENGLYLTKALAQVVIGVWSPEEAVEDLQVRLEEMINDDKNN